VHIAQVSFRVARTNPIARETGVLIRECHEALARE
jgi:hypothetical protein